MEQLEEKYFFNKLLAYREKAVRYEHHVTLFEHYLKCNTVPNGFVLKFHPGITNSIMQSRVNSVLKKCSIKLMCSFKCYYKQELKNLTREESSIWEDIIKRDSIMFGEIQAKLEEQSHVLKEILAKHS